MPRVVPDQRSKFENEEFFRKLSRECEASLLIGYILSGGGNKVSHNVEMHVALRQHNSRFIIFLLKDGYGFHYRYEALLNSSDTLFHILMSE